MPRASLWRGLLILLGGLMLTPVSAPALSFLFVDNEAAADTFASVGTRVDDPAPKVSTNRIVAAVSVSTAVDGPEFPLPAESGVATATAVTTVVAPSPTNKVTIKSSLGMGIGARDPFVATASAKSYGQLTLSIGPDSTLGLGDPMFVELTFTDSSFMADSAITGTRSYKISNLTQGSVFFDSAVQGLPLSMFLFPAKVGDQIRIEWDLGIGGSLSGPNSLERQEGDMVLRSVLRAVAIPEPGTALLVGLGLVLAAVRADRERGLGRRCATRRPVN